MAKFRKILNVVTALGFILFWLKYPTITILSLFVISYVAKRVEKKVDTNYVFRVIFAIAGVAGFWNFPFYPRVGIAIAIPLAIVWTTVFAAPFGIAHVKRSLGLPE